MTSIERWPWFIDRHVDVGTRRLVHQPTFAPGCHRRHRRANSTFFGANTLAGALP